MDATLPNELGVITLASPCHVEWDAMQGDDRARFCGQCSKHVYNVEHLTSFEVRDLIAKTEGQACMRLFRREDGTVLTQDCPVGELLLGRVWKSAKKRARLHFKWAPLIFAAATLSVVYAGAIYLGGTLAKQEPPKAPVPATRQMRMMGNFSQVNVYR